MRYVIWITLVKVGDAPAFTAQLVDVVRQASDAILADYVPARNTLGPAALEF